MIEKIVSLQNPKIKNVLKLSKHSERKCQNLIVIEGLREISLAISEGFEIKTIFNCTVISEERDVSLPDQFDSISYEISKEVFHKIAYRENSDGIIAIAVPMLKTLESVQLSDNPLILVLESIEKPGNLGAILRTADAAKVDAILICDPKTDLYNPNVIRSSIGCVFSTNVIVCSNEEAIRWLKKQKVQLFSTYLDTPTYYHEVSFQQPTAIVMGTEAHGLSEIWVNESDALIKIPMSGKIDSLNVSTSTAIVVFEAKRQRGFS